MRCLVLLFVLVSIAHAERVRAHAVRRTSDITVDGALDEATWAAAPMHGEFSQRFPKNGGPAAFATRFAVVYDDSALYVGVWADDPEPTKIRRILTRRDLQTPSDLISVGIDSYGDRRTAFVFELNAAGVMRDKLLFDDLEEDTTWDAVWRGAAAVTATGWTAEFRIPLNQLRFSSAEVQEWGFQVVRSVTRTQEQSSWSRWPRTAFEVVSKFGVLDGITKLRPGRRLELLPFVTGGFAHRPIASGDPLNDPTDLRGNLGLDLKYGLSSAFTLSATLNPDFGQVEADPSQVNLSANELFFAERRPFFLEGVDLFKLPIGNSDESIEGAFYSRRIGAAPDLPDGSYDYVRAPTASTIYGAMKLTGKTASGWSLGLLDAVTGDERATLSGPDGASNVAVAPLTNYAALRIKRDLNEGRTALGASATAVHRALDDARLAEFLHDQAYTGGLQLRHRFTPAWQLELSAVASSVHGTRDAIARTQLSPVHFYQRPDATHFAFDPERTALAGAGARWKIGRYGDTKRWRFGLGGDVRTIGLELNDLGFQLSSDRAVPYLWLEYHNEDPGDHVLNWQWFTDVYAVSTLQPQLAEVGLESNASIQLANNWSIALESSLSHGLWEPEALRGGPALADNPFLYGGVTVASDDREPVQLTVNTYGDRQWTIGGVGGALEMGAVVRPRSNIELSLTANYSHLNYPMQYVDQADDTAGVRHYVFGRIKQTTLSVPIRLNWTFTPYLALQAYAQPFIATGRYSELKDVDDPDAERFVDRFTLLGGNYLREGDVYTAASTTGATYQFGRPDFSIRELRSTVVLRWEYRPGSTVFAIWSHGRSSGDSDGRFRLSRDVRALVEQAGENVVMVKVNYWIGL